MATVLDIVEVNELVIDYNPGLCKPNVWESHMIKVLHNLFEGSIDVVFAAISLVILFSITLIHVGLPVGLHS